MEHKKLSAFAVTSLSAIILMSYVLTGCAANAADAPEKSAVHDTVSGQVSKDNSSTDVLGLIVLPGESKETTVETTCTEEVPDAVAADSMHEAAKIAEPTEYAQVSEETAPTATPSPTAAPSPTSTPSPTPKPAAVTNTTKKSTSKPAAKPAQTSTKKSASKTTKKTVSKSKKTTTKKTTKKTSSGKKKTSVVWIPRTGKKYHSNPNCSNMRKPSKVSLATAKSKGYKPCKKCYG